MIEKTQPHHHPDHEQGEADGARYQCDNCPGVLQLVVGREPKRVHHHQQQQNHRGLAPVQQYPALVEAQPLEEVNFQRRTYYHHADKRDEEKEDESMKRD